MHTMAEMMSAGFTTRRGLRFWEDSGLLGEVARSSGETRQYTPEQLDRAKIIAAAKFGGFDLDTIGKILNEYGPEVYEALMQRLLDQARAAIRLQESLPSPQPVQEYDL